MILESNGVKIEFVFDEDGFPEINIDTGSSYIGYLNRPAVEVKLNDVVVHKMFDGEREPDDRWLID